MKNDVYLLLQSVLPEIEEKYSCNLEDFQFSVDYTKDLSHGEVASNIALKLTKIVKDKPKLIAEFLLSLLKNNKIFSKIEIAGPGFINFFFSHSYYINKVSRYMSNSDIELPNIGQGKKILLEFVSANPTGPLHVGHGRGAAFGSTLATIYRELGYEVVTEYYLNDAGRQMDILAFSTWLRYLEISGAKVNYPNKCYQGEYILDIAKKLQKKYADEIFQNSLKNLSKDFTFGIDETIDDPEKQLDAGIKFMKDVLSEDVFMLILKFTLVDIQAGIKSDLVGFRVNFDNWFSEKSLYEDGVLDLIHNKLLSDGALYEKDGAFWFESTRWHDEKDRVFKRSDGSYTYFAADLAYHWQKVQKKYSKLIDIFGADHHGYIPRLRAGLAALGYENSDFQVELVQFASLIKSGEKVAMSTRSGEFVTLAQLYNNVGVDATRFFYLMTKPQQHMEFDLDVAKSKTMDNPVFYVQYAYARISSIFQKYADSGKLYSDCYKASDFDSLANIHEKNLLISIVKYEEVLIKAANESSPHLLISYLQNLAKCFHSYYNSVIFISDNDLKTKARLGLLSIVKKIIKSGLRLLSVSTPEKM